VNANAPFLRCRCWLPPVTAAWLLALALRPTAALALDPSRDLSQYNCRTWNRENGFPANGVNAVTQTRGGYLWLGTSLGLLRFDGVNFTPVDLNHDGKLRSSIVTSLASAAAGGLWAGLRDSAFGFYDGQTFSFRGQQVQGKPNLSVHALLQSRDGTLWLATENGAFRLTPAGNWEQLFPASQFTNGPPNVLCLCEDASGRIWLGTASAGVYCWQPGTLTRLPDPELESSEIGSLAADPKGQLWVGTANGLRCYDANLRRQTIPLLVEETRALLVDRHGVLWIGTSGRGVGRLLNGRYEFLQKPDGLADNYVNALAEDAEGSLWIGTRDGVSQLTDVKFPIEPAAGAADADALSVAASRQGGIWIGSSAGVTYFNGTAKTYGTETGLPGQYAKRVFEASNGDLYVVCNSSTLAILSGKTKKVVAVYTNRQMFVGMTEDAQGMVVSVAGSLYRVGTNYFRPYEFAGGETPPMWWILNLATGRNGAIWVASVNGIFRVKDGRFQQWTLPSTVADPRVTWVCQDSDGVVWGATSGGIVRLKDNQLRLITRKDGLFDDNICTVLPDDRGQLWVDSARGIFSVSRQAMNDFADGKARQVECRAYDDLESVKITGKTVQENVACQSTDGRLWFPYPSGVVGVDPAHILTDRVPPPVHIESVRANGVASADVPALVVPPGRGDLEFHFDALSFVAPEKIHFRYRLAGYDPDWVDAGNRRLAFYTNLKPGAYTFHVIAANADGVWNTVGDTMKIVLRPRYYQTAWFDFACGGLVCAALIGSTFGRIRLLEHRHFTLQQARVQLETQVQRRTQELAAANTSLKDEIAGHKRTTAQLEQRTQSLEDEIEERKRMQSEIERVHRQLLETSRQAGMAEVATSVLHNVGNVLNSINVSTTLVLDRFKKSRLGNLGQLAALVSEQRDHLAAFFTADPRGRQLPDYLAKLAEHLAAEQADLAAEIELTRKNVEHIKDIVTMQQNYAKVSGVVEKVKVTDLVEDALRMNVSALARHDVHVVRDYPAEAIVINVERQKVLQILVNLIRNAKYACGDSGRPDKLLMLRVRAAEGHVQIVVLDNGVGIPAENLTRIFNHGFTTRENGHGFGLHSGALTAKELGGALTAHSDGPGAGARFVLELPLQPPRYL
jgi:ligand-binding sensor domain-containing protein/signal transduction histidine kinase